MECQFNRSVHQKHVVIVSGRFLVLMRRLQQSFILSIRQCSAVFVYIPDKCYECKCKATIETLSTKYMCDNFVLPFKYNRNKMGKCKKKSTRNLRKNLNAEQLKSAAFSTLRQINIFISCLLKQDDGYGKRKENE